jgi:cytochrome c oxidase subunit IV
MSDLTATHDAGTTTVAPAKPQTAVIWRTFWILSAITALEFTVAFLVPAGSLKVFTFVAMTIVKAFYIVGEFMHLRHEAKALIWAILLPALFVIWLLIAMLREAGSIFELR